MSTSRYWVVGGTYQSLKFDALIDGTGRIWGPFETRSDAETMWREASEQDRWNCCTRFTIAQDNVDRPARWQQPRAVHGLASCVANDHAEGFIPHG
jgi:hypothetical protein